MNAEFGRLGGPSMPGFPGRPNLHTGGWDRAKAIEQAQFHADKTMLEEIHLMLRYLCKGA
jgi:hypothetical protein